MVAGIHLVANAGFPIQFAPPINFPSAHSPLWAGDFNGDGVPDLAVGYTNNNVVAILTNDGTGTLRLSTSFRLPLGDLRAFATGDFNGDNKLDLVAAGDYATICINNGNGTFTSTNIPGYLNATAVAVGDFNRDRKLDVATAGYYLSIFLAQSNGAFALATNYVSSPLAFAAADLDGNTRTDLVFSKYNGSLGALSTSVLLANVDGTFTTAGSYPGGSYPGTICVATGDLDKDGKPDLIVGNTYNNNSSLSVRLNNGDGTFGPENKVLLPTRLPYSIYSLAIADFDGDGNPDILVGDPLVILPGLGNGSFASPVTNITSLFVGGIQTLAVADFDGDGRPDIATTSVTNNAVSILLNRTPPPISISISIQNTGGLLVLNWLDKPGFNLEFTTNLALPNSWSAVTNSSFVVDGQRIVVTPSEGSGRFFRLRH